MQTQIALCLTMLVMAGGCTSAPSEDLNAEADATAELVFATVELTAESKPDDEPAPKPGDTCPSCDGKGYNGDGRNRSVCKACDGTGIVPGGGGSAAYTWGAAHTAASMGQTVPVLLHQGEVAAQEFLARVRDEGYNQPMSAIDLRNFTDENRVWFLRDGCKTPCIRSLHRVDGELRIDGCLPLPASIDALTEWQIVQCRRPQYTKGSASYGARFR